VGIRSRTLLPLLLLLLLLLLSWLPPLASLRHQLKH